MSYLNMSSITLSYQSIFLYNPKPSSLTLISYRYEEVEDEGIILSITNKFYSIAVRSKQILRT